MKRPADAARLAALALSLAPLPGLVLAQDVVQLPPSATNAMAVGATVLRRPEYLGSAHSRTQALPLFDAVWDNGIFASVVNGVGVNLSCDPAWQFGPRLTIDQGRDADRTAELRGFEDVKWRPEYGAFLNYAVTPHVKLVSSVRHGSGQDRKGTLATYGVQLGGVLTQGVSSSVALVGTYANGKYQQEFFGVNARQAAASGLTPHRAEGGLRDLRLAVNLQYALTPAMLLHAGVNVAWLQGDAKDSPLSKEKRAVTANLSLMHYF